jgi:hypothetical protein
MHAGAIDKDTEVRGVGYMSHRLAYDGGGQPMRAPGQMVPRDEWQSVDRLHVILWILQPQQRKHVQRAGFQSTTDALAQ